MRSCSTSPNTTEAGRLFHPRRGWSGGQEGFKGFPEEIHVREDLDGEAGEPLGLVRQEENGADPGVESGHDVEMGVPNDPAGLGFEAPGLTDLEEGRSGRLPQAAPPGDDAIKGQIELLEEIGRASCRERV